MTKESTPTCEHGLTYAHWGYMNDGAHAKDCPGPAQSTRRFTGQRCGNCGSPCDLCPAYLDADGNCTHGLCSNCPDPAQSTPPSGGPDYRCVMCNKPIPVGCKDCTEYAYDRVGAPPSDDDTEYLRAERQMVERYRRGRSQSPPPSDLRVTDEMARQAVIDYCEPVYGYVSLEPNARAIARMKAVLLHIVNQPLPSEDEMAVLLQLAYNDDPYIFGRSLRKLLLGGEPKL